MGWKPYQTVDPLEKEPQFCRALFQWCPSINSSLQNSIFRIHQTFNISYFHHFNLSFEKNLFHRMAKNHPKIYTKPQNIGECSKGGEIRDTKTLNLSRNIVSLQVFLAVSRFSPGTINLTRNKNICCGLKKVVAKRRPRVYFEQQFWLCCSFFIKLTTCRATNLLVTWKIDQSARRISSTRNKCFCCGSSWWRQVKNGKQRGKLATKQCCATSWGFLYLVFRRLKWRDLALLDTWARYWHKGHFERRKNSLQVKFRLMLVWFLGLVAGTNSPTNRWIFYCTHCYQTDLASGEWKNESASLAEYVEKLLMLDRAVDVLCATSNFNSTSTLLQLYFSSTFTN